MSTNLTKEAIQGFNERENCAYLHSSPSSIAWHLGAFFYQSGRTVPRDVRMSRGYSIRANDMIFAWKNDNTFERIK